MSSQQENREPQVSLLVRNLSFATSPDQVRSFFERFGEIRDVYLPLDYETRKPRGFGFVEYYNESDATSALENLDNAVLDGNTISVTIAKQGRKSPDAMRNRDRIGGGNRYEWGGRGGGGRRSRSRSYSPSYRRGGRGGDRDRYRDNREERGRRDRDRDYHSSRRRRSYSRSRSRSSGARGRRGSSYTRAPAKAVAASRREEVYARDASPPPRRYDNEWKRSASPRGRNGSRHRSNSGAYHGSR